MRKYETSSVLFESEDDGDDSEDSLESSRGGVFVSSSHPKSQTSVESLLWLNEGRSRLTWLSCSSVTSLEISRVVISKSERPHIGRGVVTVECGREMELGFCQSSRLTSRRAGDTEMQGEGVLLVRRPETSEQIA